MFPFFSETVLEAMTAALSNVARRLVAGYAIPGDIIGRLLRNDREPNSSEMIQPAE
jgi:hypothetical protein